MAKRTRIDAGEDLLKESEELQVLVAAAVLRLGIWIHPDVYQRRPHLVPFAIRDASCRSKANRDGAETWGSPNPNGFFRDDNSLIKNWVKSFPITSPNAAYNGKRIGTGFVACHVWRDVVDGKGLHADALLNSFVPNLVWLPSDLARLSDRARGFTQRLLQVVARNLYAPVCFDPAVQRHVNASWERLPPPSNPPCVGDVSLSFFRFDARAYARQADSLRQVFLGISDIAAGKDVKQVYSKRYAPGLRRLPSETLETLAQFLRPFTEADQRDT